MGEEKRCRQEHVRSSGSALWRQLMTRAPPHRGQLFSSEQASVSLSSSLTFISIQPTPSFFFKMHLYLIFSRQETTSIFLQNHTCALHIYTWYLSFIFLLYCDFILVAPPGPCVRPASSPTVTVHFLFILSKRRPQTQTLKPAVPLASSRGCSESCAVKPALQLRLRAKDSDWMLLWCCHSLWMQLTCSHQRQDGDGVTWYWLLIHPRCSSSLANDRTAARKTFWN